MDKTLFFMFLFCSDVLAGVLSIFLLSQFCSCLDTETKHCFVLIKSDGLQNSDQNMHITFILESVIIFVAFIWVSILICNNYN